MRDGAGSACRGDAAAAAAGGLDEVLAAYDSYCRGLQRFSASGVLPQLVMGAGT